MASIPYDKFPILPTIDSLSLAPASSRVAAERDSLFQTHLRRDDDVKPPVSPAKDSPPKSETKPAAAKDEAASETRPANDNRGGESAKATSDKSTAREADAAAEAEDASDTGAASVEKKEKPAEDTATEPSSDKTNDDPSTPIVANVEIEIAPDATSASPEGEAAAAETSADEIGTSNDRKSDEHQSLRHQFDAAPTPKDDQTQRAENRSVAENAAARETIQAAAHAETQTDAPQVQAESEAKDDGKEQSYDGRKAKVRVEAAQATEASTRTSDSVTKASQVDASGEAASPETALPRDNPSSQASSPTPSGGSSETAAAPLSRLPQHLIGRGGERGPESPQLNEADHARFVQRVARAFQAAQNRDGEIRLRLSPPELGSLRLELKVQGGALTARIEAETTAARQLLLDNLPVLRQRLAEQGVRVEQFDVDLTDRQPGGLPDGPANEQQRDTQPGAKFSHARGASDKTENVIDQPAARRAQHDGRLNVVV
jgi:flagellar hook-length control protein FliK